MERINPCNAPDRLWADHIERYRFGRQFVRGKHVLDAGCGSGYGYSLMGEAASYTGIDIDLRTVNDATRQYGNHFRAYDLQEPLTECYDVILCFEVIEHVDDELAVLRNLKAACRETLLISTPNRSITSPKAQTVYDRPANPHHIREWTPDEMVRLLQQVGFRVAGLYGQRQRPRWIPTPTKILDPFAYLSSAKVKPLWGKPRYFIAEARI